MMFPGLLKQLCSCKIWSIQPLPLWEPDWDSGRTFSAISRSLSCKIHPNNFLPHPTSWCPSSCNSSCVLGMGTLTILNYTSHLLHLLINTNNLHCNSGPPQSINSGKIPVLPPLYFLHSSHQLIRGWGLSRQFPGRHSSINCCLNSLVTFNTLLKCLHQSCFSSSGPVVKLPSCFHRLIWWLWLWLKYR